IAKNESGQSAPSNVIRLKHTQKNLPPVITLQDMLSTTVDKGVQLNAAWLDDNLPDTKVSVAWSHDGKNNVHFCDSSKEETRVWF
ncbi:beta-1,4 mannanase, partial [Escherichia coli]|nr:beta-1,4 mannanase [Escherichia coli]